MKRFFELLRKYLPVWVALSIILGLLVGKQAPGMGALEVAIPLFLFVMLYPMMINLRIEDIGRALADPKLMLVSVAMNFILTPILGALWARGLFAHASPYLAVGFILKVTVPCSGMVAAWTGYAKGKVESALVIVALSLTLSIFLVPLWMWALAGVYVKIDPWMIFQKMLLIVVVPLVAGLATRKILVRRYGIKRFKEIAPYFPAASTCGMLLMVFLIIGTQAPMILANSAWMALVIAGIATLYPLLFVLAIGVAKVAGIDHGNGMALGYSVTAKNHAITIGVATTAFGGTLAVLPAAVAPIIQIPVMLLFLKMSGQIKSFLDSDREVLRSGSPR